MLMNNPWFTERAEHIVNQLGCLDDEQSIRIAYRTFYHREPSKVESELAKSYLQASQRTDFVHALLTSNEMIYVD
jgi:hypothetical protein